MTDDRAAEKAQAAEAERKAAEVERQRVAAVQREKQAAEQRQKKADDEAARRVPQPGQTFRDCPDVCPEMVVVPTSIAGSKVSIPHPIAVGKFEVTFAEWDACVAAGGCQHKPGDRGWGRANRPVIDVSWNDVTNEFLPWLSKKTGKSYRLLSEAEWEYAARAGTTTNYPWGHDIGKANANCNGCSSQWDNKQTAPVGSFKPNAFGLYDMNGNVWQWVEDSWHSDYNGAPADGSAWVVAGSSSRVLRGGSWNLEPDVLRSASRVNDPPDNRFNYIGFRLARTL